MSWFEPNNPPTPVAPPVLRTEPLPEVEIRPHPRSRRLKLSFRKNRGFLLTHPPRVAQREIHRFLKAQQQWMQAITDRHLSAASPAHPLLRDYLLDHPHLTLDGVEKPVRFSAISGLLKETEDAVLLNPVITDAQLIRKLQILAKEPLSRHLLKLAAEVGVKVASIHIRDQRSRWGSCSGRKSISLNWRLILMPHALQRHILLHELAHIPHPNHSKRFWDCLQEWDPDTSLHRETLRKHGSRWIALGRDPALG